ncbi:MAG: alpha-amylase/4-alpha-glucanotransferase domain-containing protein [Armatimonadota bacterium]
MTRPQLTLALALHNHQPVGNFPYVFDQAYRQAYEPMVGALERHPSIRLALHYSGPLLDWLKDARPDLLDRIRALVGRGQVEILTGGYYEPILPIIPDRDKYGQITKLTAAVKELFGVQAAGLWLAERVWEPHLPKALAGAGVSYTIVDDAHFLHVGLTETNLVGHFVTEEEGATVSIFPSAKSLRYRIPWWGVPDLMEWLRAQSADEARVLVMGDDGEKFGLWPGTWSLCWDRGWVEQFFTAIEEARDWLTVMPPGEWIATHPARGRIYLPTGAYDEMTEWALPAAAAARLPEIKHELEAQGKTELLPFLQGGYWRHFLVKYPEINTLHKMMLRVSRKVWRMRPGPRKDAALDHVWQAQCNCPYWHGVFGGIYLGHIRSANYAHLIEAERIADSGRHSRRWIEADSRDLDADGRREILVSSDAQVLLIDPDDGGTVVTWDARQAGVNLVNVMTRRAEGYHETLRAAVTRGEVVLARSDNLETIHTTRIRVKEWGLEKYLAVDQYRRSSFAEHFQASGAGPAAVERGELTELGDFVGRPFEPAIERGPTQVVVRLSRDGRVQVNGGHVSVHIEKALAAMAGAAALTATYRITNRGERPVAVDFAVETNWGTSGPDATVVTRGAQHRVGKSGEFAGVEALSIRDPKWGLTVEVTLPPCALWVVPIEVVSASEAGFERSFQGASLWFLWPLHLDPGGVWEGRISCMLRPGTRNAEDSTRSP